MYLLAVSGGPDSMFLLNRYKTKKVVVAHVNYGQRNDASVDQKIVTQFCDRHKLKCHILKVAKTPQGNFQSWARTVRYEFFQKLYRQYRCKKLLVAHHKDDFLETALMQQASGRTPRFFGIKKQTKLWGMNVYRPYVNLYWKDFILAQNKKVNLPFAVDSSNQKTIYQRNKVRKAIQAKTKATKQSMFEWFLIANKILKKKFKRVDKKVRQIIKSGHPLKSYQNLALDVKEVLYEIIHSELQDVKLSTNKINSFIEFINGQDSAKKFIINQNSYVHKKDGRLFYIK